jgi:hypothetical protein
MGGRYVRAMGGAIACLPTDCPCDFRLSFSLSLFLSLALSLSRLSRGHRTYAMSKRVRVLCLLCLNTARGGGWGTGLLAMANRGSRHTNTSQFYITFDECKWCGTCLIHSGARHSS